MSNSPQISCLPLFVVHDFDTILANPSYFCLTFDELIEFSNQRHTLSFANSVKMAIVLILLGKVPDIVSLSKTTTQRAQLFFCLPFFHISIFPVLYHYSPTHMDELIDAQTQLFNPVFISSNPIVFSIFSHHTNLSVGPKSMHIIFEYVLKFLGLAIVSIDINNFQPITLFGNQSFSHNLLYGDLMSILTFVLTHYSPVYTIQFFPFVYNMKEELLFTFLGFLERDCRDEFNTSEPNHKNNLLHLLFCSPYIVSAVFKSNHTYFFPYCDFQTARTSNPELFF